MRIFIEEFYIISRNLFNPNKTPWINFMGKTIQKDEIEFINSIKNNKQDNIQTISPGSKFFWWKLFQEKHIILQ